MWVIMYNNKYSRPYRESKCILLIKSYLSNHKTKVAAEFIIKNLIRSKKRTKLNQDLSNFSKLIYLFIYLFEFTVVSGFLTIGYNCLLDILKKQFPVCFFFTFSDCVNPFLALNIFILK